MMSQKYIAKKCLPVVMVASLFFCSLIAEALAWIRYSIDIPFLDDWRILIGGDPESISLWNLFQPANDTIYATGKFLDALAARFISYNSVVYQLVSMILCFFLIFVCQIILLQKSTKNHCHLATALIGCLFMLQTGSYWGQQDVAYEQAIPLISLLICLSIQTKSNNISIIRFILIIFFAVIGGLSYISGAFVDFGAMAVALLFAYFKRAEKRYYLRSAAAYGISTVLTLPIQLWVILFFQHGHVHRSDAPWVFPWTTHFWAFILGMIAHAVGLNAPESPESQLLATISLIILLLLSLIFLYIIFHIIFTKFSNKLFENFSYIYSTIFVCIGIYCLLVASGRTSFGATSDSTLMEYFVRGGARFHFFWLTILIPWVIAFLTFPVFDNMNHKFNYAINIILVALAVLYINEKNMYNFDYYFQSINLPKLSGLRCIQNSINSGDDIYCPSIYPSSITNEVFNAVNHGWSFTHYIDFPIGWSPNNMKKSSRYTSLNEFENSEWLFVSGNKTVEINSENGNITADGNVYILDGQFDSRYIFSFTGEAVAKIRKCHVLHFMGILDAEKPDFLQLFYSNSNIDNSFSEENSVFQTYKSNHVVVNMTAVSEGGFSPTIRLDPGNLKQIYRLSHITVTCKS